MATHANDNRPAEFDAALERYMPMVRALAVRYLPTGQREDVIQDVMLRALSCWRNFHGEYTPNGGFPSWLRWQLRAVISAHKTKKRVTIVYGDKADRAFRTASLAETQERSIAALDVLNRMTGRDGAVLLRRGMGFKLSDIGAEIGVSRERVRQIEEAGIAKLRAELRAAA
ncbi:hypothetical protein B5M44_04300 [Shinella sumterensis]|uniref:sigma-70 family RNA polymerase sigma factor n=1 Tax=Shinella sumterensis TaxID=1967501 RepID=UPI00106EBA83|nr:sigma-70 family RNA polymerase sigma factor [Shinella sumterensis]MCD1264035.1 sigma-70 family RNA polymerase sigma factor [Shinella sumterensis]TFE99427.1 hypothetical protein B5M44_04300 [Shinella sumterensis]